MNPVVAALVVQAVLIVLLLAAGAGLYRRVRELELATFRGIGLSLTATASGVSALTAGRRAVVVKINRRCPVCEDILGAIDLASAQLPADTDVVVVSDDPHVSWRSSGRVRVVSDPAVWRSINVPYAPALLVVDENGMVSFSSPVGSAQVLTEIIAKTFPETSEVSA